MTISDEQYDVSRTKEGKISINLGGGYVQIPPESALKLACLLLKYAGCAVRVLSGSIVATYSKKSLRAGPADHKDGPDPARLLN